MSANPNARTVENAIDRSRGVVWNRLHSERQDICKELLKEPVAIHGTSIEDARRATNRHKELLQERLRKIDDALDRVMSGSYGHCSKCGRWIEDTNLDFDPAIAFCIECWRRPQSRASTQRLASVNRQSDVQITPMCDSHDHLMEGVALNTLAPFDAICVRTHNSNYRLFIIDPTRTCGRRRRFAICRACRCERVHAGWFHTKDWVDWHRTENGNLFRWQDRLDFTSSIVPRRTPRRGRVLILFFGIRGFAVYNVLLGCMKTGV